jgi:acyl-CoA synthetase (AMP-forming)/AMP-acid ligase II
MHNRIHDFLDDAAANRGDTVAIHDYADRAFTWTELKGAAGEAEDLLRSHGLKAGDRLVMVFENCVSVPVFFYAASRMDAIIVPINARLTEAELERVFAHSDPSVVMFSTDVSEAANAHAVHFGAEKVTGSFGEAALMRREGADAEPVFADGREQVALMLYTSGTTGTPKAAMLTQGNLNSAALASVKLRGRRDNDVTYLALPLSHIYGFVALLSAAVAQTTLRLEPRFDVARLYEALQTDVTLLPGVPQMHAHLFHYARAHNKAKYDAGHLRFVSSGGAPLDPAWKREAEAFYGLPLQNGYGLTEGAAGVCATLNEIGDPDISVGRAMGECVLRLDLEALGAEPDKGIGEILLGGPQVMKGYFRDPERTAEVMTADGFFKTGDLGRFDAEGRLHIAGRSKELIIRSGFNVYPVEVEGILTDHPEVIVAGVVGRPVEGNEEVLAFVKVAKDSPVTEEDLKAFLHDRLAPYKRPSKIVIAHELPAAPTGKILKSKLIETFADDLAEPA